MGGPNEELVALIVPPRRAGWGKATMASPFRESIEKLLNGIEGAVSCALMGFDGITVDISSKEAATRPTPKPQG